MSNDLLVFGAVGSSGTTLTNDIGGLTLGGSNAVGITFAAGAAAYTLTGSAVTANSTSGASFIVNSSSNVQTINFNIVLNAAQTISVGTPGMIINGVISGAASLSKNNAGTLTLTGTNTFNGTSMSITGGALSVATIGNAGAAGNLGAVQNIQIGSGANTCTLIYTGAGENTSKKLVLNGTTGGAIIDQSGSGTLDFTSTAAITTGAGSKTLTLQGSTSGIGQIDGIIQNNSVSNITSLTKAGTGTWILTGSNTYTGNTTINGGSLLINGNNSTATGTVTVNANATLGGTGTIGGAATAASDSFLSPGTNGTAGNLTLASTLDISGLVSGTAGHLKFDLGSVGSNDKITLTSGVLSIGAGNLNFDDFNFTALSGFGPGTYTLFDTTQTISGSLGSNLTGLISGQSASLSLANSNQDLVLTVVPEPDTYAMILGGFGLLIGLQRLRRRSHT